MDRTDTRPLPHTEIDAEMEARLDAKAVADADAGRVIPHERMAEWLTKLANGQKVPPPFDD
jgi:predicted transcriptional regulator